ncbi:hypothetical protein OPL82_002670, partial [Enterococcus faecalis]|nr:hypothetical protein [Enterococcus faecalis]
KHNEYVESPIISNLAADNINFSKLNKLYPEIKASKVIGDRNLSDKEQKVAEKAKEFIEATPFEQVIDVFSDSLYDDIPKNDKFQGQKYETTDLKDVYENKIKKESKLYANLIVSVNQLEEYDQERIKEQLILVSYFIRWGNFSNGKHMFWNELYSPQSDFMTSEQTKQLNDKFIQLFAENPKQYLVSRNVNNTFKVASQALGQNDAYKQFVERFLLQNGITDYSQWFYDSFKGRMYKDHYEGTNYDVGIWNRSSTFNNFLPYLLNQSDTSNLMIGETRGEVIFLSSYNYQNDFNTAEKVLKKAMKTITNTLELYDRTIEDKELINVDKVLGQRTILDQGRNWLDPEDSLSYELYRVAHYDGSHPNNGAVATGGHIQMQAYSLTNEPTLAHELAHELNSLFNADSEFYSTYVNNVGRQKGAYLNTFGDGEQAQKKGDTVANKSTFQIQSKEELVSYAKNMEDMVYVLDGIIATKVLELPVEEQVKYIKLANVDGDTGTVFTEIPNSDEVQTKDLTIEELKQLNIKTIDDLIDNDAVIMQPDDTNRNILRNHGQGYGTTLTYSAFFLANGKPIHHTHRIINTLLSKGGWEAFKEFNVSYNETLKQIKDPELNNDEKSAIASSAALRKVYNNDTITYRKVVRDRYTESMNSFKENGLLGESYESIMNSMSSIELYNFYSYKV